MDAANLIYLVQMRNNASPPLFGNSSCCPLQVLDADFSFFENILLRPVTDRFVKCFSGELQTLFDSSCSSRLVFDELARDDFVKFPKFSATADYRNSFRTI